MATRHFKVLRDVGLSKGGTEILLKVDKQGIPLERFWRDRLKDGDVQGFSGSKEVKIEQPKKTPGGKAEIKTQLKNKEV